MTTFGPYELLRRLGAGGTAEVFLARGPNPAGEELLAVKLVLPHLLEDGRQRQALLREARAASVIRHPNVVEVYEVGEFDERPYLAMEYVRGWALNALLKRLRETGQSLSAAEACALVREAALGLHAAHEATDRSGAPLGLVHRDVSPHNLILREDGHLKVVDFGLAKATAATATQTGGMKGKLAYMPPEQIQGKPLDRRADVFACGAILFELLAGEKLYPGKSEAEILQQALFQPLPDLAKLRPELPLVLFEVMDAAIAREPGRRLPSAQALAEELAPFAPADTEARLAQRVQSLFEPLPRTAAEARGQPRRSAQGTGGEPPVRLALSTSPRHRRGPADDGPETTVPGRAAALARARQQENAPPPDPTDPALAPSTRADAAALVPEGDESENDRTLPVIDRAAALRMAGLTEAPPPGWSAPEENTASRDATDEHLPRKAETNRPPSERAGSRGVRRPTPSREAVSDRTQVRANPLAEEYARGMLDATTERPVEDTLLDAASPQPDRPTRRRRFAAGGQAAMVVGVLLAAALVLLWLARPASEEKWPVVTPVPRSASSTATPGVESHRPEAAKPARHADGADRAHPVPRATVSLTCNVLAKVSENGRELGMTPVTVELPAGAHRLEVMGLDGTKANVSLNLHPGEKLTREVTLSAP